MSIFKAPFSNTPIYNFGISAANANATAISITTNVHLLKIKNGILALFQLPKLRSLEWAEEAKFEKSRSLERAELNYNVKLRRGKLA